MTPPQPKEVACKVCKRLNRFCKRHAPKARFSTIRMYTEQDLKATVEEILKEIEDANSPMKDATYGSPDGAFEGYYSDEVQAKVVELRLKYLGEEK